METYFYATNNGYTTTYNAYNQGVRQGTISESELREIYPDNTLIYKDKEYIVSEFFED